MTSAGQISAIELHEQLAAEWEQKYERASFRRRASAMLAPLQSQVSEGQLWLDAGCGSGYLSRRLIGAGCEVIGVDGSTSMIQVARKMLSPQEQPRGAFLHVETVERLPFESERFEGVLCSSVFEYLDNPRICLQELCRVLKPGGLLLVSVPYRRSGLRRGLKMAFRLSSAFLRRPWPSYLRYSINELDVPELAQALHHQGFEVTSLTRFSPFGRGVLATRWLSSLLIAAARKRG